MSSFNSLELSNEILHAIEDKGYHEPTPIQKKVIPAILKGNDIMACAQTGTGKTAAFTLPLLHRLSTQPRSSKNPVIKVLVLTPTRELAAQVQENIYAYSKYLPLRSTVVFGGVNITPQIRKMQRGVDILVATPGRLLDHVNRKTVDLSHVNALVLDEADRMLDMGFIHDIKKIIELLPKKRLNILLSATFSKPVKKLASSFLNSAKMIDVTKRHEQTPTQITQVIHPVDRERKRELLSHMIGKHNWQQVLVFTRTKHSADRLSRQLERDGIAAAAIHGDKSQGARSRVLSNFKRGAIQALIATDIASRGLDITQLSHVVNFELPQAAEDYVHRIGRTGRAGKDGKAISLVSKDEKSKIKAIEKLLKYNISREIIPGYETRGR